MIPPTTSPHRPGPGSSAPSFVDVAIIGAGPAGCMVRIACEWCRWRTEEPPLTEPAPFRCLPWQAADVLSRFTDRGLSVRVFDKRSVKLDNGALRRPQIPLSGRPS